MHYLVALQIVVSKAEKRENETAPRNESLIENGMAMESVTALMKCGAAQENNAAPTKF